MTGEPGSPTERSRGTRPLGVGIVGLSASGGWAAGAHLPALSAVDGMELTALTTSSRASAAAAGAAFGVPGYASVDQLVEDESVDLVVVAVKVPRHRELVLPALRAGVPVLSEWPFAVDLAEAVEMEGAARETRNFIGLHGRSSPTLRWLAASSPTGTSGDVLSATVLASSVEWGNPVSEPMLIHPRSHARRHDAHHRFRQRHRRGVDGRRRAAGRGRLDGDPAPERSARPHRTDGPDDRRGPDRRLRRAARRSVLSVHHRGATVSGPGFSLLVDGTEGTLEITSASGYPHLGPLRCAAHEVAPLCLG